MSTRPGADRVDVDALARELERQRLGEADDPELGRAVGGEAGAAALAHGRGQAHDLAAAAALDHVPGDGPGAQKRSLEVDRLDRVPGFLGKFDDRHPVGTGARGGVVHQDVDAPETLERPRHHGIDLSGIGYVGEHRQRLAARGLDLADHRGRAVPLGTPAAVGVGGDVADDYVGAFVRQAGGDGAADAALLPRRR